MDEAGLTVALVWEEDYEGTDGVALSTSNTLYAAFTDAPVFDTAQFKFGSSSGQFTDDTVTADSAQQEGISPSQSLRFMRRYVRISAWPTSFLQLMRVRLASTALAEVRVNSAGNFILRNGGSTVATSTATWTVGQWWRIEWKVDSTGTTQELRIFNAAAVDSATPTETISGAYSGGVFNRVDDSSTASSATTVVVWFDQAADDDAAYPGPFSAGMPWTYSRLVTIG